MFRKVIPFATTALLLAFAAPGFLTAHETEEPAEEDVYLRTYPLGDLSPYTAEILALRQCPNGNAVPGRCLVRNATAEEIVVGADAATHQKIAEALQKALEPAATPQFQIVLVRAHKDGQGISSALPDNVHAALEDASTLLPYTRYELLDTGLVRSQDSAELKLIDAEGQQYSVVLSFSLEPGPDPLRIDFHRFQLAHRGNVDQTADARGLLLSTSFDMALGETLVVGTSKLNGGGEGLIALVTAVEH